MIKLLFTTIHVNKIRFAPCIVIKTIFTSSLANNTIFCVKRVQSSSPVNKFSLSFVSFHPKLTTRAYYSSIYPSLVIKFTSSLVIKNSLFVNRAYSTMASRSDWIVVGVSGVTCGGKTTLANRLKNSLCPVYVFHQDKYFYPDDSPKHVKCDGLDHNNYDILSSLDMGAMYGDVLATLKGENRSHSISEEREGRFEIKGKKFLVVEGFTVLNYKPILDICDLRYFFVLEYGECVSRRCLRLYDPPDVAGYFETCVWPHYLHYKAEILKDKRIKILDGTQNNILEIVMADIKSYPTIGPT